LLSHTAEYALRAVLYIAQHETETELVRNDTIAAALDVPRNYLSKILHALGREGLLQSTRGPTGGFRLARSPDAIPLLHVVAAFDQMGGPRNCILGRARCSDRNPCPAHGRWKDISEQVSGFFRETTVGDLLRDPASLAVRGARRSTRR
jgi:Rrf2 family protein